MAKIKYRLFFNDEPATQEQLDRIDEISVEQEIDMAWEARLTVPACMDDQGNWQNEDEPYMQPFARIRIEIQVADQDFVPLIDGPVVGHDQERSAQPGESTFTVIVQDDSIYLNRTEQVQCFENMTDDEIATQLFSEFPEIDSSQVDAVPPASSAVTPAVVQRGTAMQLLRQLARRNNMHAYVLPGDTSGGSIGYFAAFTRESSDLPPLVPIGSNRNVDAFNLNYNPEQQSTVQAFSLSIGDKAIQSATSSFRNQDLLGDALPGEESESATQLARPTQSTGVDVQQRADAESSRSALGIEATGSTIPDCYAGVLQPYKLVQVRGVNASMSGDYEITKATHTLTRSNYLQSFELRRNGVSEGDAGGLLENIF